MRGCTGCIVGLVDIEDTFPVNNPSPDQRVTLFQECFCEVSGGYVTHLTNPRWLLRPYTCSGSTGLFSVDIPPGYLPSGG